MSDIEQPVVKNYDLSKDANDVLIRQHSWAEDQIQRKNKKKQELLAQAASLNDRASILDSQVILLKQQKSDIKDELKKRGVEING